jgi:hypothetical protein
MWAHSSREDILRLNNKCILFDSHRKQNSVPLLHF